MVLLSPLVEERGELLEELFTASVGLSLGREHKIYFIITQMSL
jgi:hypothetical protein